MFRRGLKFSAFRIRLNSSLDRGKFNNLINNLTNAKNRVTRSLVLRDTVVRQRRILSRGLSPMVRVGTINLRMPVFMADLKNMRNTRNRLITKRSIIRNKTKIRKKAGVMDNRNRMAGTGVRLAKLNLNLMVKGKPTVPLLVKRKMILMVNVIPTDQLPVK